MSNRKRKSRTLNENNNDTIDIEDNENKTNQRALFTSFLNKIQKKDTNRFFSFPVSDEFAPGYSTIIKNPMDFSTMKQKINNDLYVSIDDIKDDFNLMCENAKIYNQPDTIYYKAAAKLQASCQKILSEKKCNLKDDLIEVENDFEESALLDNEDNNSTSTIHPSNQIESCPEIVAHLAEQHEIIKKKIKSQDTYTRFAYFTVDSNCNAKLNIINPDFFEDSVPTITTESLMNKNDFFSFESAQIQTNNDAKKINDNPSDYFKNIFNNIPINHLIEIYGSPLGVCYALSMLSFVDNGPEESKKMVHKLLDVVFEGKHSEFIKKSSVKGFDNDIDDNFDESDLLSTIEYLMKYKNMPNYICTSLVENCSNSKKILKEKIATIASDLLLLIKERVTSTMTSSARKDVASQLSFTPNGKIIGSKLAENLKEVLMLLSLSKKKLCQPESVNNAQ